MNGQTLMDAIGKQVKPHHDTIYCTDRQKGSLASTISGSSFGGSRARADNLTIMGLDVVVLPRIERPIVCRKGEVFDLAKDYKYGKAE